MRASVSFREARPRPPVCSTSRPRLAPSSLSRGSCIFRPKPPPMLMRSPLAPSRLPPDAIGRAGQREACLLAFDLLAMDGEDLRPLSLQARRGRLEALLADA